MYGEATTITGGKAIRYNNVLTVEFKKANINAQHPLSNNKDEYMLIRAKVTKNHCVPTKNPYVTCEYIVKYGKGTDTLIEVIEEAINQEVVIKSGAWIREYEPGKPQEKGNEKTLPDGTKAAWNGMAKFTEYVTNNNDYYEYLKDRISGNIKSESLSDKEIEELKQNEANEAQEIEELEAMLDDTME